MFENIKSQAGTAVDVGLREYMLKVYNFMAGGLAITGVVAFIFANTSLINLLYTTNSSGQTALSIIGWLLLFAPLIMIFAFSWVLSRGTTQQVQLAFWVFSGLMGAALCPIFMVYTGTSITRIFLITSATFGAMSIYGYTTKKDLTNIGSFMIMGVWGIIIASIVNMFMQSPALYYAISILTVVAFTVLTAYDTQKIRQMYLSADTSDTLTKKAIAGALALYMDFINMFLALLRLFGDRK